MTVYIVLSADDNGHVSVDGVFREQKDAELLKKRIVASWIEEWETQ